MAQEKITIDQLGDLFESIEGRTSIQDIRCFVDPWVKRLHDFMDLFYLNSEHPGSAEGLTRIYKTSWGKVFKEQWLYKKNFPEKKSWYQEQWEQLKAEENKPLTDEQKNNRGLGLTWLQTQEGLALIRFKKNTEEFINHTQAAVPQGEEKSPVINEGLYVRIRELYKSLKYNKKESEQKSDWDPRTKALMEAYGNDPKDFPYDSPIQKYLRGESKFYLMDEDGATEIKKDKWNSDLYKQIDRTKYRMLSRDELYPNGKMESFPTENKDMENFANKPLPWWLLAATVVAFLSLVYIVLKYFIVP